MLAVARWGSALSAWPPLIIVATQVVPILPTIAGSARRVAIAALSFGLAPKSSIAAKSREPLGTKTYAFSREC